MVETSGNRQHTVLCIDDEEEILAELVYELSKSGFNALGAANGEEALKLLKTNRPDVILCDIIMPGLSGMELLTRIRQEYPSLSSTPFIFLTALIDRTHVLEGLKLGADDYLTKPVDFEVLGMKISRNLELVKRVRAYPVSDVSLKFSKRELQVLTEFAKGRTNAKVADILGLSEHTIGDYAKSIFKKLNVTSRPHAVHEAMVLGLISVHRQDQ